MAEEKKATPKIARIEVDRDACISVASCVDIAPEVFELDDEGKAVVKNAKGNPDDVILESAQSCPVNAIILYDEAGNKIWPA
ncbi:MAG: ferredoxin [Patescibacteria group bacterium]|jgi:ferredoxin